jgi:hypothetical protein
MKKIPLGIRGVKGRIRRLVGRGGVEWIHLAQDRDRWRPCCECGDDPFFQSLSKIRVA